MAAEVSRLASRGALPFIFIPKGPDKDRDFLAPWVSYFDGNN
jgi:hypothetical protein